MNNNLTKVKTLETSSAKAYRKFSEFKKYFKSNWGLYIFASPAVILLIVFSYFPMYGLQIAFKNYSPGLGFADSPWVGFDHFSRFFSSPNFFRIIGNTFKISLLTLLFSFPAPIILAMFINQIVNTKFKKTVQMLTYAPHFISVVVVVGMLSVFLSPSSGLVNHMIKLLGGEPIAFMQESRYFLPTYIISGIWQSAGWETIIYLAALSGVSPELHESAIVDGASKFRRIIHIDIPSILPTIIIKLILSSGAILSVGFEKIYLMQNDLNMSATEVISTYVYKIGLINMQFSFSTAVGLFNALINFIILFMVNKAAKAASETSLW